MKKKKRNVFNINKHFLTLTTSPFLSCLSLISQCFWCLIPLILSVLLFLLPSFLGLLRLGLVNGSGGDKGDLLLVFLWHVHLESIRNSNSRFSLVHLKEDADDPGDGAQGGVEHVAVLLEVVHVEGELDR